MASDPERLNPDEFQLIERYFARGCEDPRVVLGIGDDAAVVDAIGTMAIATDTLVSGVHFPEGLDGDSVGHRALAVNLSDLAAMGAEPRWCTLALTLPGVDHRWLEAFARGFFALAETHGVDLVGGDTTRGPLTVTVHLIGAVDREHLLTRGGGREGDDVYVTGSLGDGAAGLALVAQAQAGTSAAHEALRTRFLKPTPRVEAGLALRTLASSVIDVSDGLLADVGHLCRASGCAASIDLERLPISAEARALFPAATVEAWALSGGDDYELCFTAPPAHREAIRQSLSGSGTAARRIGRLTAGDGVQCRRRGKPVSPPSGAGYSHFGAGLGDPKAPPRGAAQRAGRDSE